MTAWQIVLLVAGILALNGLVWVILLVWLRGRVRRSTAELNASLAATGEQVLIEPAPGNYRGASDRFGRVKGRAVLALTDRRVIWSKVVGGLQEVALSEIVKVGEDKWFLSSYNGRAHLILHLRDGTTVGLQPRDHGRWKQTLGERIAGGSHG